MDIWKILHSSSGVAPDDHHIAENRFEAIIGCPDDVFENLSKEIIKAIDTELEWFLPDDLVKLKNKIKEWHDKFEDNRIREELDKLTKAIDTWSEEQKEPQKKRSNNSTLWILCWFL